MKTRLLPALIVLVLPPMFGSPLIAQTSKSAPVKNIVLVHGAFADGSGWEAVANILKKDGYTVSWAAPVAHRCARVRGGFSVSAFQSFSVSAVAHRCPEKAFPRGHASLPLHSRPQNLVPCGHTTNLSGATGVVRADVRNR